jgi:hypothetical protein
VRRWGHQGGSPCRASCSPSPPPSPVR